MKHPKHTNQVRIIGGTHRSRIVHFHTAEGLRPSADVVREKLFNWLGQRLDNKNVLDLFAGSGILGFEAASRGAAHTAIVEKQTRTAADIAANLKLLDLPHTRLCRSDALDYLHQCSTTFDIVFLDPPYAWQDWAQLWPLLQPRLNLDAEIYIEAAHFAPLPEHFLVRKQGISGISNFMLARYTFENT